MVNFSNESPSPQPVASAPSRNGERGFTLVETIVAVVILTVGLVAIAELLAVSVRMHQIGRDSASAAHDQNRHDHRHQQLDEGKARVRNPAAAARRGGRHHDRTTCVTSKGSPT